jgi:hypothetical protein
MVSRRRYRDVCGGKKKRRNTQRRKRWMKEEMGEFRKTDIQYKNERLAGSREFE